MWPAKGVAEFSACEVNAPKENEVLVRTRVTLISPGTERAFFLGAPGAAYPFPWPAFGYSNVGEVIEVGSAVEGLKVGQRVACGTGHCSHFTIEPGACLPIADSVSDEEAVFFNMITIALQGMRKARVEIGEPVVVIGAGMIGLLAMRLAKLQGALPAVIVDRDEFRVEFAKKFGADVALINGEKLVEQIQAACAPTGAAVVIEATGFPEPILTALLVAKRFGRVVLLGSTRGEVNGVDFYRDVHRKGLTIIGAHNGARPQTDAAGGWWPMADDFRTSLRLLESKRLDVLPLITHRFAAKDAAQAYELLAQSAPAAQAMLLNWV